MKQRDQDSGFENFRRKRNKQCLTSGEPLRNLGTQANVLRQLEEAEAAEIQDERLSREVTEFFEEATRTAAAIMARVAETQEQQATEQVSEEMQEFLVDAIQRMGTFVDVLKDLGGADGERIMETHMQNLVGPMLDSFRLEGTAHLEDQHLGQDPFDTEIDELSVAKKNKEPEGGATPAAAQSHPGESASGSDQEPEIEKIRSVMDHSDTGSRLPEHELAPEVVIDSDQQVASDDDAVLHDALHENFSDEPDQAATTPAPAAHPLLEGMMGDEAKLKGALRLLVSGGLMSKEEARTIFRSRPKS